MKITVNSLTNSKYSMMFNQIPSLVYLWTAVFIFAASSAVTRKVTEIGEAHLVNGRNPISLCNVLFAGNLCALAVMLLIFGRQWNRRTLQQLTRSDWIVLGAIAVLSGALAPGLIFAALDQTNVTNVVLIARLEPPLTLALSVLLLRARVNVWTVAGSVVALVGVATIAFLSQSDTRVPLMGGLQVGLGEVQVAIAAVILASVTVISKARLQHIPIGIFNIAKVAVGTVVFFLLANILYGSHHFTDILSPFLWQWMLLYGSVIVVAGQLCWFAGLRGSTPADITLANAVNPIVAIAMAFFILGEVPTMAQYAGGTIIFVGIILSLIGSLREARSKQRLTHLTPAQQMGMAIGFRGV